MGEWLDWVGRVRWVGGWLVALLGVLKGSAHEGTENRYREVGGCYVWKLVLGIYIL